MKCLGCALPKRNKCTVRYYGIRVRPLLEHDNIPNAVWKQVGVLQESGLIPSTWISGTLLSLSHVFDTCTTVVFGFLPVSHFLRCVHRTLFYTHIRIINHHTIRCKEYLRYKLRNSKIFQFWACILFTRPYNCSGFQKYKLETWTFFRFDDRSGFIFYKWKITK